RIFEESSRILSNQLANILPFVNLFLLNLLRNQNQRKHGTNRTSSTCSQTKKVDLAYYPSRTKQRRVYQA
ncbi:unnamed protein product, partial [Cochlearia groenlandica]